MLRRIMGRGKRVLTHCKAVLSRGKPAIRTIRAWVQQQIISPLLHFLKYGGWGYSCPICQGHFRKLMPSEGFYYIRQALIDHYTANSICPRCGSGIRHRFIFSFLQQNLPKWKSGQSILHFAPEQSLYAFFQRQGQVEYVPCDLYPNQELKIRKVDIVSIDFPPQRFDLIVCIHVLEHIQDDHQAISELFRILKPGGQALIAVPIYGETTFEDPSLNEVQREKMYGIGDHRRLNGLDLKQKLEKVGFCVRIVATDEVPGNYMDHTASSPHISSDKFLFWCTRPMAAGKQAA